MRGRVGRGLHGAPAELTRFVGRRQELAELKRELGRSRLVTLTGPAGVGKTRLAVRAAGEVARSFPDGVWMVELAGIANPQLIPQALFHALGLQDATAGWTTATLTDFLGARRVLLVVDNCEHLLDSIALLIASILRACPHVRVLATSRQALGTDGEVVIAASPLRLPDIGTDLAGVLACDAVALFADRARSVDPAFVVDGATAPVVVQICRRLDGIPLALELAAARLVALDPEQLLALLDDDLLALRARRGGDGRQQTLEAAIGWSHRLLTEPERLLWSRLSVFADGFDGLDATEVCADRALPADQVPKLLASLVEQSVLRREPGTRPARYRLLAPLREFGRARLRAVPGVELDSRRRHRDWVQRLAAEAGAWDGRQAAGFDHVDRQRNDLWAALDTCLTVPGEAAAGVEICRLLYAFWNARGPLNDARRVVGALLERLPDDSAARADGLWLAAGLAIWQGDLGVGRASGEQSLEIARRIQNQRSIAWATGHLGVLAWVEQRPEEARRQLDSAIAVGSAISDASAVYWARSIGVAVELMAGDLTGAETLGDEVVADGVRSGELWARGIVLGFVAEARWRLGNGDGAMAALRDGIECKRVLGDQIGLASRVEALASMLAEQGSVDRAAVLLGAAAAMRERIGPVFPAFQARHDAAVGAARRVLGDEGYEAAFARGHGLSVDDAVAGALDRRQARPMPAARARRAPETSEWFPLTPREREVALLVGRGCSNREIAAELVISERTAETHVWNIFNKLGLSSRAQIATWAAARGAD